MTRLSLLALAALATSLGCSKSHADPATLATSTDSSAPVATKPSAVANPASSVAAPASDTAGCVVKSDALVVDTGVRTDTGITFASAMNAIGYAKGKGTPAVATFDEAGSFTTGELAEAFPLLEIKPEPSVRRAVDRVEPIGLAKERYRVAVDFVETRADKTRRVYCGTADAPYASFDGPSLIAGAEGAKKEMITCSTVATADGFGALTSTMELTDDKMLASLALGTTVVASRETAVKLAEKTSTRYGFTLLGSSMGPKGSVYSARFNGIVVLSRGADELKGAPGFWLGTGTNTPIASLDATGERATVWNTLAGKPDLYRATFLMTKAPETPITVALPTPIGLEERGRLSVTTRDGESFVTIAEKIGGKQTARLYRFDSDGKLLGALPIASEGESVSDSHVKVLPSGDLLVAYVTSDPKGAAIKRQIVSCSK